MSGVTETGFIVQDESYEYKCGLDESVFNSRQKLNHDENHCECKGLGDYMWNPSTCDCECNKACKIDEHLDTKSSSYKKRLISKLVLECEDEMLNTTESSLDDINKTCEKSNNLINTILFPFICLLLLAGFLLVAIICGILVHVIVSVMKHVKLMNI